ncbi:unnamed protein product [Lactuca virosa]|uniref:Transposase MuDR plant domain-containing protein n=1 Tax=Lactuca virosa TaxID=75947 RepID=A0AAU9P4W4_9ASTR|nr:unnamed protein product [Lactuca virosa]
MFDAFSLHQELSNIDLYLEVEVNGIKNHIEITPRCRETFSIEQERDTTLSQAMIHTNGVSDMIQNEDFDMISHFSVVTNGIDSGFDMDNEDDEIGQEDLYDNDNDSEGDANVEGDGIKAPTGFTSLEGIDVANVDNWMMSHSENTSDLIQELGENSFKSKEELIRTIKLYTIRKHRQYEVIETCPTIWKIRCKLCSQTGCKWQLRACKCQRSGYFEITRYTGPHTCFQNMITQDHPNLDASLITQETEHLIKEQPSISVPTLRAEIIDKLGYTPSYRKVWLGKQKAIERIYGIWEESYIILPKFLTTLQYFNLVTIVEWYCLRHFVNNFHDKFRNSQLKVLAYRAGSQNQVRTFNSIMEEIGKLNAQARQWIEGHSLCRWTLAHDCGKRYGLLTTNMSEIFNSVLKGARFFTNHFMCPTYIL